MVVLYGSILFIFVYLTYLTNRSRNLSREVKQRKVAEKKLLSEIAILKAELHGQKTERTKAEETGCVYTD